MTLCVTHDQLLRIDLPWHLQAALTSAESLMCLLGSFLVL